MTGRQLDNFVELRLALCVQNVVFPKGLQPESLVRVGGRFHRCDSSVFSRHYSGSFNKYTHKWPAHCQLHMRRP